LTRDPSDVLGDGTILGIARAAMPLTICRVGTRTSTGSLEEQSPPLGSGLCGSLAGPSRGAADGVRDALLGEVERFAQLGGFVWTRGDDTPHWSEELYRLLGYDSRSVRPSIEAFFAAVHPDDRERVKAAWDAACDGALGGAEYRIVRQSTSEVRYVRAAGQPYLESGQVQQIIGAVQDITEARRSALALEEAKAIVSTAQQLAGISNFVLRVEPPDTAGSQGVELHGVEAQGARPARDGPDAAEPASAATLERVHPEDREKHARWWERLRSEGIAEPLSVRVLGPNGSVRYLQTQAARVRLADGVERVVGTTQDVTERVELADQLRHAAKMETIGTLAAGVAHDFNNYLMVLDQSLSMLADCEGGDREDLVASGRLALSRSRDLTRQLLAFARRQPFSPESVDLAEVVRRFYDLLNRAVGRRAVLRIERSVAPLWCRVDPHHVERMLTNLVVNAADAIEETGRGSGRITVSFEGALLAAPRRAQPGDVPAGAYACVVVEDNGGGIDASRLPRIFEPYFTTKPEGRGTGLGLASVYGMARQNNGQVTVSELPRGTRFTLWFPRIDRCEAASAQSSAAIRASSAPANVFDHRILIALDIDSVRDAAQRILSAAGFRTLSASNGQDALDLLDSGFDVRLILTDLEMPVMSGRQLAEHVGQRESPPPLIFMTGFSETTPADAGELGHMLLAKPFTPERLIEFVKRALKIIEAHQD
jgi:two-component system cell cycle sensor histidine kinase/response regulator CckA